MPHSFCRLKTEQLVCSGSFSYVSSAGHPTTDTVTPSRNLEIACVSASPSHPTSVYSPALTDSASSGLSSWFPPPCPSYHLPLPVFLAVGLCSFLTVPYTPATHGCVYVPPRHSAVFTALNPVSCSSICLASAGSPFASLKLSLPRWNVFLLHPPSHCSRGFITGHSPCSSCSAESCLAQSRSDSNGVRLLVLQICCPRSLRGVTAPTATSALPSLESQLANITGKTPSTSRAQGVRWCYCFSLFPR